jgi:hypothetical protein
LFKTLEVFKDCERKTKISHNQLLLHSDIPNDTIIVNEI